MTKVDLVRSATSRRSRSIDGGVPMCALLLGMACSVSAPASAQRPAPPKSWTIDTSSGAPVALRRGGAMSSDARAELLGPVRREGPALLDWIRTFARDNAATLGTIDEPTKDEVAVSTIAGQQVAVAAYSVRTAAGSRYISYGMLQNTPSDAPVIVVRSTFGDALTMVRVFRSSVEALMPYILSPMSSMRTVQTVATGPRIVTSFRGATSAALPPAEIATAPAANGDSALSAAVGAGISDVIAHLDSTATAAAVPAATSSRTPARTPTQSRAPVRAGAPAAPSLAAALSKVVFYQFGDLQYHPVALFRDGTSLDIDEAPLELINPIESRRTAPGSWGRWRSVGSTYYLSGANGGQESDYRLDGGGMHTAFPAPPGTTLDGTFKSVSGSSMGETSTLTTTQIRFSPDGRFSSGRDFQAVGSGEQTGVTMGGGSSSSSAGRYRVSGYRLVMTYDSGAVKEYFFAFSSSGTPAVVDHDMVFVGGTAYVK